MKNSKSNKNTTEKTFLSINFGCRVNAAETNQWSQALVKKGLLPTKERPDLIFVNTCSITKKGDIESIGKIRFLSRTYPKAKIIVSGCAALDKVKDIKNVTIVKNQDKEKFLKKLDSYYSPKIKDKFTSSNKFLLKVQSGCQQYCSYCIVPFKRSNKFSLPISKAIKTVEKAIKNGYKELIVTGVNLEQYKPGFSNLIEEILNKTNIELITFGSIPLNCIDKKIINLYKNPKFKKRLTNFLHIPIQSGSKKILKSMNRPYSKRDIIKKVKQLKKIPGIKFGTDIIVAFPNESEKDFQETLKLCQKIGFQKIHCFRYSPRPNTKARIIFEKSPKIPKEIIKSRSQKIRDLISQNKLPSHQKQEN